MANIESAPTPEKEVAIPTNRDEYLALKAEGYRLANAANPYEEGAPETIMARVAAIKDALEAYEKEQSKENK